MKKFAARLGMCALAILFPQHAFAITECTVKIASIFTGDDGYVHFFYVGGGSSHISKTDADFDTTVSFALSALLLSRQVTVRYAETGVACITDDRSDLIGMYI